MKLHKNHLIYKNSRSSSRLLIRISNDYQNNHRQGWEKYVYSVHNSKQSLFLYYC